MLHAHSDDESFLSAGLIMELLSKGYKLSIVYLASSKVRKENKTYTRLNELRNALNLLGVQNFIILPFCEPKYVQNGNPLYKQKPSVVAKKITKILNEKSIHDYILFSYDKNGGYGNKDHLVAHKVGRFLCKSSTELFEITIPRQKYKDWITEQKERGVPNEYLPELSYWAKDFGLPESQIDYTFELNPEQIRIKRKAMIQHTSQIKPSSFPLILNNIDFKYLFGYEYISRVK